MRDNTVDILRGFAIYTMILSNTAGEFLQIPHPFIMRVFGSMAAPLFILLSGYSLGYSVFFSPKPYWYYWKRGLGLILTAALIDSCIWMGMPFLGMDVLYLIGISTILSSYILKFPKKVIFIFIIFLFISNFYLRTIILYPDPNFISLTGDFVTSLSSLSWNSVFLAWILNGWFPIIPWLGIFLLGALGIFARPYFSSWDSARVRRQFYFGLISLVLGISLWNLEPKLEFRSGYTELFYPPTISYYLTFLGGLYFLYLVIEKNSSFRYLSIFSIPGKYSLSNYILHFICIGVLRLFLGEKYKFTDYHFFYYVIGISIFCFAVSFLRERIKQKSLQKGH